MLSVSWQRKCLGLVGGAGCVVVGVRVGGWIVLVGVCAETLPRGLGLGSCDVFVVTCGLPLLLSSVFDLLCEVWQ